MKNFFVLLIAFFLVNLSIIHAQSSSDNSSTYTTALGLKFYPTGITLKHFLDGNHALEGLGYFYNYGTRITGLYEIYGDINNAVGLRWYIGPGAHFGFYNTKYGGGSSAGVDGVLGLDYKVTNAPLNLSLDWQPSFEFGDNFNNGFSGGWGGFGIRYTF
ncbi:MAG: hypothetical protein ABJA57_09085 [Ginsengibacter sp.]